MDTTQIPMGTVVVGVDGSPASDLALDWAIAHASREQRPLTLAHGLDPAGAVRFDAAASNYDAVVDAMQHDGRDLLQHARERVSKLAPDLSVHESLWQSDARVTLLKLAERAHVVVVGSRGRGPVKSLLLGSVGVAVSRHAPSPVVVVRPGHPGAVRNGVMVGADATPESRPVLEFAFRQASLRDLPLTIQHCTDDSDGGLGVAEAVAGLAEKFPEVRSRTLVTADEPGVVLARESRRMDLVVVGAHRSKGFLHVPVTSTVVEHAECPVAVIPLGLDAGAS